MFEQTSYQIIALFLIALSFVNCVDHSKFKTCDQSGFCKRNRELQPGQSKWQIDSSTIETVDHTVEALLSNPDNSVLLKLKLSSLLDDGSILRMHINEYNSIRHRYEALEALNDEKIALNKVELAEKNADHFKIKFGPSAGQYTAIITHSPFKIDVYCGQDLILVGNERGLFNFEHYRKKESVEEEELTNQVSKGMWEESFSSFSDSKPYGPMSVGLDFSFVGFNNVYGIPEHADSYSLKDTKGHSDPYRLFNTDVFEYELDSPMTLYGSVPMMIAQSAKRTIGLLWLNPSETWIDIETRASGGLFSDSPNAKLTHWISETGVVDVYLMVGETFSKVMEQNAALTGKPFLPPIFSTGYHQCRWNYFSENEVLEVDSKYDQLNYPVDAIWLDIEYTDGKSKKYFTWDSISFSDPEKLTSILNSKGRRLITIIDPHLKRDSNYPVFNEAQQNNYMIKNRDNQDYEGHCWPGASMWPDFLNPAVSDWWGRKFIPEFFPGFTKGLVDYWNDMNEPSVFNGPEATSPRDLIHYGDFENRDIHNIYGYLMTKATFDGLTKYRPNERPFILTRSFFVGSQKHCAAWTGDNMAKWTHLRASIPMILSLSSVGISFSGADVGGFFYNPENENLLIRWYQAGAFQPFFRAHAHIETKKREPWMFNDQVRDLIGESLKLRHRIMPYYYTLFYEAHLNGMPPMRPLFAHFGSDEKTFNVENAHMVGDALLVHPVLEDNVNSIDVYLPGEDEIWLNLQTKQIYDGGKQHTLPVTIETVPHFQLGGSIIPIRERLRRSVALTVNDPIVLDIFADKTNHAEGRLFIDDGISLNYKKGDYIYTQFVYQDNTLINRVLNGQRKTKVTLEKVRIYNYLSKPSSVNALVDGRKISLTFDYNNETKELIIRKPDLNISVQWQIVFN